MSIQREFDVIVYGATGFTGRLVAEYLQAEYGNGKTVHWAMAGRSSDKLASVRDEMGLPTDTPLIVANSDDPATLMDMAKRAKTVLTTVGPYQLYGEDLVKACVEVGTDYVDLCGEPAWMHDIIRTYQTPAEKSGARIVLSCGFDSVPFDLGVFFLQNHAMKTTGQPCTNVRGRVRKMQGTFSGGTAYSFRCTMERAGKQPEILGWLKDPFSLVPGFDGPRQPAGHVPKLDADIGTWAAPFIMASINTKNVHRSNALLGFRYGEDFTYDEMVMTGPGDQGKDIAEKMASRNPMADNPPAPGEGPSKEERENGFYDVAFIGETHDGKLITASVAGDKDPGYGSTSKMIAECALCLAQDIEKGHVGGGVYTTAPAMGEALIARLQEHAGLTFKIE